MAKLILDLGTPNQNDGDNRRAAFEKVQLNFDQLFDSKNEQYIATFKSPSGTFVASPETPLTNVITISKTDAVNGATTAVWYKGSNNLTFAGGDVVLQTGYPDNDTLCLVWMIYDKTNDVFVVNIQNGITGFGSVNPAQMTITSLTDTTPDETGPAQMEIIQIVDSAPAQMTITIIT